MYCPHASMIVVRKEFNYQELGLWLTLAKCGKLVNFESRQLQIISAICSGTSHRTKRLIVNIKGEWHKVYLHCVSTSTKSQQIGPAILVSYAYTPTRQVIMDMCFQSNMMRWCTNYTLCSYKTALRLQIKPHHQHFSSGIIWHSQAIYTKVSTHFFILRYNAAYCMY